MPSMERLGWVGEEGMPPIVLAVVNVVAVLTGKRLREVPLRV